MREKTFAHHFDVLTSGASLASLVASAKALASEGADVVRCYEHKPALLTLARQLRSAAPKFTRAILAYTLFWYGGSDEKRKEAGITVDEQNAIAAELFALEREYTGKARHESGFNYRMLIKYGLPDASWWNDALAGLLKNALSMSDPDAGVRVVLTVALNAAPATRTYDIAFEKLTRFLRSYELTMSLPVHARFLASTIQEASADAVSCYTERNVWRQAEAIEPILDMAQAVFWEWSDKCLKRLARQDYLVLMMEAIRWGSEELARQAEESLCCQFERLVRDSPEFGYSALVQISDASMSSGEEPKRFAPCFERLYPILAAVDLQSARRARGDGFFNARTYASL